MKKLFLSIVVAAATAICANAQLYVGAGYSYSPTASKAGKITERFDRNGFYIQAGYGLNVGKHLGIVPGLEYEVVTKTENDVKQPEQYLNIPVKVTYGFSLGNIVELGAFVAPTFSMGLTSKAKVDDTSVDMYGEDGFYKRGDFRVGLGVYCDLIEKVRINLNYNFGVVNRSKVDDTTMRRNGVQLGVAYLF
ncbi:MAG: outer membrane beta-barrel protein [Candidatus Cryptobacteroides sp.]|nr:porin family protein [Bacteroidales bacterium]MDY2860292.1 outer membrane beta-barrel protein [Candidatus Cryptobacteroides sp.]MCI7634759.1 porin family protein [Bacteroidales bacterium]MDD7082858.1 outer membrane beta-barrel protein [Bacteroidales bacterium]MDD7119050.1 outer membrane beta-barrel protein [Bacteroidales bacterium]